MTKRFQKTRDRVQSEMPEAGSKEHSQACRVVTGKLFGCVSTMAFKSHVTIAQQCSILFFLFKQLPGVSDIERVARHFVTDQMTSNGF